MERVCQFILLKISGRLLPLGKIERRAYLLSWLTIKTTTTTTTKYIKRQFSDNWHPVVNHSDPWEKGNKWGKSKKGRRPCEVGGRELHDVLTSQEMPRIAGNRQQLGERHMTVSPSVSKGNQSCQYLDFCLLTSWTMREYIFVVLSPSLW